MHQIIHFIVFWRRVCMRSLIKPHWPIVARKIAWLEHFQPNTVRVLSKYIFCILWYFGSFNFDELQNHSVSFFFSKKFLQKWNCTIASSSIWFYCFFIQFETDHSYFNAHLHAIQAYWYNKIALPNHFSQSFHLSPP